MKVCDLYGFQHDDLENARYSIEDALGVTLTPHESLYYGGLYFRLGRLGEEHLILRRNLDLIDNEPEEQEYPEMEIVLYINETLRSQEIERILSQQVPTIELLRRVSMDQPL